MNVGRMRIPKDSLVRLWCRKSIGGRGVGQFVRPRVTGIGVLHYGQ